MTPEISTLPRMPLTDRASFPREPVVYVVLTESGRCFDIGETNCLWSRWNAPAHHRIRQMTAPGLTVAWANEPDAEKRRQLEKLMIATHAPILNGTQVDYGEGRTKILVTITEPQDVWLKTEAKLMGISANELLRRIIDQSRTPTKRRAKAAEENDPR